MKYIGRMWIFEDKNINTDQIFPGKYTYDPLTPEQMAEHALEDYLPSFSDKVKQGDIIVADTNFGSGSSREQAVTCLKAAGVSGVIAKSFARIYYRNAINNAFPLIQCPKAVDYIFENKEKLEKEEAKIDMLEGKVIVDGKEFSFPPLKGEALKIFSAGGLAAYTREKLEQEE
jgi:3-isopropylmalate/(R)-2-methylmalate dehydratase small subunit